ncbi:hypothetical protein [Streptomyces sp. NPDC046939]|uniref:hypothetical protein n=1 Tax=Streptomyces sp. NPDC046939 TaxID=3155376 RepID=UPI0033D0CDD8
MGVRPDNVRDEQGGQGAPEEKKRLDLSVPQVAGSAVAAVVAAKLASSFGVYGTILGAGVVSAIATCGGTVFQHFFRRTGEQIRDVAVHTKPRGRHIPVTAQGRPVPRTFRSDATMDAPAEFPVDATKAMRPGALPTTTTWGTAADVAAAEGPESEATQLLDAADAERTRLLGTAGADPEKTQLLGAADPERTRLLGTAGADPDRTQLLGAGASYTDDATRALRPAADADLPPAGEEFTEGTVHRARVKSWKRPLIAAAVVFGVTMGGITTYELVAGHSFSGDSGSTTFRDAFSGHRSSGDKNRDGDDSTPGDTQPSDDSSSGSGSGSGQKGDGSSTGGSGTPTPSPSGSGGSDKGSGTGSDTGSGTGSDQDSGSGSDTGSDTGSGSGDGRTTPTPTPTPTPSQSTGPSADTGSGAGSGRQSPAQ